jgi:hypothetical protein
MKTTIEINRKMAMRAYDAITDNKKLEEQVTNDYPNVWIIDSEDEQEHDQLLIQLVEQLATFGINENEYEVINE